ncbi:MAG TPA: hypothetical protein VLC46_12610 [Thermoanaerobaculia bacterium]|jgi:hypothetical protein|nr:hypothetical protein [Thermoanaerobaculia bacterium]
MRIRILLILVFAMGAGAALAVQPGSIDHTPPGCMVEGEMAIMSVETSDDGLLRAYFRRQGSTDWCFVDGKNLGKVSQVTLPKFDPNEEIEYYFIVLDGKRVVAKSPRIYNARNEPHCDATFARHAVMQTLECLPPGTNPITNSMSAGYAAKSIIGKDPAPTQSPEKPGEAPRPGAGQQ